MLIKNSSNLGRNTYTNALRRLGQCLSSTLEITALTERCEAALQDILHAQRVTILPAGTTALASTLSVPIILDGAVIGTIYVGEKRTKGVYSSGEIELLTTFSLQAATAFSHAILYARMSEHAQELEAKVAERTRELERAQEHQKQLMLDVSHNLQTPLALFQIKLEQLKNTVIDGGAVQSLESSLNDMSRFISAFLHLAHVEHGSENTHAPVNLSQLLEDVLEEIRIVARGQKINIGSAVRSDVHVAGDSAALREAVLELTSNALKYMGTKKSKRISFSLTIEDGEALLRITDTGIGIGPQDLPRIFDRFWRAKNTRGIPGSGMGLSLACHIVKKHGGIIHAESEVGVGTIMTVRLPLCAL